MVPFIGTITAYSSQLSYCTCREKDVSTLLANANTSPAPLKLFNTCSKKVSENTNYLKGLEEKT